MIVHSTTNYSSKVLFNLERIIYYHDVHYSRPPSNSIVIACKNVETSCCWWSNDPHIVIVLYVVSEEYAPGFGKIHQIF
jgi:hypothetical protein